ncbi:MAG: hypothetical protein IPL75_10215 [Acidobacteria bacterium]|nr:hypothetical protein [Acidobacteriota bacterium]
MTFARTVRLLVIPVLTTGALVWSPSLIAQYRDDPGQQYVPGRDSEQPAYAGDAEYYQDVPAYVSAVDGSAQLYRGGDSVRDFEQVPLEVGDRLSTSRGRVEVLFSDGSVIALDEYTDITIDDSAAWRLQAGRLKVTWRAGSFDIDARPAGAALVRAGGDYRITLSDNRRGEAELELAVSRGLAELENSLGRTSVRAGTRALTTASYAPSVPYAYTTPRDDFERWTESLEADRYGVESVRYLPVELRAYGGDFDRHGSWGRYGSYGWVWYPRVSVGWQPYRTGRWSFVVNFGYSWIGGSRWEWPTHHYGRWERGGSRWFWVPQRPVQARRVGYAAPRPSFNASVPYYSRPNNSRPFTGRPSPNNQRDQRDTNYGSSRPTGGGTRPPVIDQRRIEQTRPEQQRPEPQQRAVPRGVPRNAPSQSPQTSQSPFPSRNTPMATRPQVPSNQRIEPQERQRPSERPTDRRAPSISRPSPQESRPAPPTTRQSPSSERPTQSVRPSQPQRSGSGVQSPPRSGAPSGSRTPSTGQSGGRSGGGSGTAVRRGRSGG